MSRQLRLNDLPWRPHPMDPGGRMCVFMTKKGEHISVAQNRFTGGFFQIALTPAGLCPLKHFEMRRRRRDSPQSFAHWLGTMSADDVELETLEVCQDG